MLQPHQDKSMQMQNISKPPQPQQQQETQQQQPQVNTNQVSSDAGIRMPPPPGGLHTSPVFQNNTQQMHTSPVFPNNVQQRHTSPVFPINAQQMQTKPPQHGHAPPNEQQVGPRPLYVATQVNTTPSYAPPQTGHTGQNYTQMGQTQQFVQNLPPPPPNPMYQQHGGPTGNIQPLYQGHQGPNTNLPPGGSSNQYNQQKGGRGANTGRRSPKGSPNARIVNKDGSGWHTAGNGSKPPGKRLRHEMSSGEHTPESQPPQSVGGREGYKPTAP